MPVEIESRRFGKHKLYHIVFREVRRQSFGSRRHDVIDKNEHSHLQSTHHEPCLDRGQAANRIT